VSALAGRGRMERGCAAPAMRTGAGKRAQRFRAASPFRVIRDVLTSNGASVRLADVAKRIRTRLSGLLRQIEGTVVRWRHDEVIDFVVGASRYGVSTGQGCAERTAEGGRRALTRAQHRNHERGARAGVGLRTYLRPHTWGYGPGPQWTRRTRGANQRSASRATRVNGLSPRRSDRLP
jgi:hypothetical protein